MQDQSVERIECHLSVTSQAGRWRPRFYGCGLVGVAHRPGLVGEYRGDPDGADETSDKGKVT